jgi:hypothetical protein
MAAGDLAAVQIIGQARRHQQAQIGVAGSGCGLAEGHDLARGTAPSTPRFRARRSRPHHARGVVELPRSILPRWRVLRGVIGARLQDIEAGHTRVVEEHVGRARLPARIGPGWQVPVVAVVWYCRPGSAQGQRMCPIALLARLDRLGGPARLGAPEQIPVVDSTLRNSSVTRTGLLGWRNGQISVRSVALVDGEWMSL